VAIRGLALPRRLLDLFSRRVVGWATSDRLGEGVALEALGMGLARRRPRPGLLHHSDRGLPERQSRQLLGQRCGRKLLRDAQSGARPRRGRAHTGRRTPRRSTTSSSSTIPGVVTPLGHLSPVAFERQWRSATHHRYHTN